MRHEAARVGAQHRDIDLAAEIAEPALDAEQRVEGAEEGVAGDNVEDRAREPRDTGHRRGKAMLQILAVEGLAADQGQVRLEARRREAGREVVDDRLKLEPPGRIRHQPDRIPFRLHHLHTWRAIRR